MDRPRSVVYVKVPGSKEPEFRMREIEIGPSLSNTYVVLSGLSEGEEIVANGTFAVDASAQLAGKPSMMNPTSDKSAAGRPEGNQASSRSMPGMDMGTDSATPGATQNTTPGATLSRTRSNMEMKMIKVSGNCEMCEDRIETAAKSVSGVTLADWSIEKKMLHVEFDGKKTNSDAIQKAIASVGHDTEKYKALDDIYSKLPECCLYRKSN